MEDICDLDEFQNKLSLRDIIMLQCTSKYIKTIYNNLIPRPILLIHLENTFHERKLIHMKNIKKIVKEIGSLSSTIDKSKIN